MLVEVAPTSAESAPAEVETTYGTTLVVDLLGALGAEYAAEYATPKRPFVVIDERCETRVRTSARETLVDRLVVMLPTKPIPELDAALRRCAAVVERNPRCRVCLVGSWRAHFGDEACRRVEADAVRVIGRVAERRVFVLRAGEIAEAPATTTLVQQLLAPLFPLVSPRFRSCYLQREELFEAIEDLARCGVHGDGRAAGVRYVTLLGENRTLRDAMTNRMRPGLYATVVSFAARVLNLAIVAPVIAWLFALVAKRLVALRRLQCEVLEPTSVAELLALYNPYNRRHVALAGYNTGVTHFGWKYPGRTVVRTTGCGRRVRIGAASVSVDAGVTIKRVVGELNRVERQLYVVPNYSYVSLGTTFFVPIHGSASDVSTLGDTIESVLLYDPTLDRIVSVRRGEPAFARLMYDPASGVLVLRLKLRIRSQLRYFKQTTELPSPTAADVWRLFADATAANIELRKSQAAANSVQVSKYHTQAKESNDAADDQALEIPRDSIGRIWDRLEENPLTSALFHGFVRRFGFHVELFLDEQEFAIFWEAHTKLPLSKIQLRFVRADGIAHSPFGRRDCISADLFMRRSESLAFLRFMKEQLPHARFNPGKHSM